MRCEKTEGRYRMNLTDEDIIEILKLVEQSKFDSLHLEYGSNDHIVRLAECRKVQNLLQVWSQQYHVVCQFILLQKKLDGSVTNRPTGIQDKLINIPRTKQ